MSLNVSTKIFFFSGLLILTACSEEKKKVNEDSSSATKLEKVTEARLPSSDVDKHPADPMNTVHDYQNVSSDSEIENWIILSESSEAKKSRKIFDDEISKGNYIFQNRIISEYISLAKNRKFSLEDRRKYIVKALWTWQRISPNLQGWNITNEEIPEKTSERLESQRRIQDIIITLNNIENE